MAREDSAGYRPNYLAEEAENTRKLIFLSFGMRLFSLVAAVCCAFVIDKGMGFALPGQVFGILYAWSATVLVYMALFKMPRFCKSAKCADNLHFSYYFIGVLWTTALVHFMGGIEWVGILFYVFDIVYANALMNRVRGTMVTLLVMAAYFSVTILEQRGLIPHSYIFGLADTSYADLKGYVYPTLLITGFYFMLLSYATGLFAKVKEDRERRLIESSNRFESKSVQLGKMARALRKKVAENTYMKRATMGYIEKKEFEIEAAKKDLEEQIDKLRKTQKSMFFMIEDLNEMSSQLKDARDNLEAKVRERTDELLNISRKLHRSERLAFLGKLAGSVTHELRNPLAVLKNAAYFLDKKYADSKDEKVLKYMDIIKKEIGVIDAIIDDIMGFAKTRGPQLEMADIKELVESAITMINVPELVTVTKEFQELPPVQMDTNQVLHAIMNIANNAIMAMNGNGTLIFRTVRDGRCIRLDIEDTGPGIPPEQRELIFEPLYSSKPKGTGLGLPIARMMIENQDGRIEFRSELGVGTVFSIFLPIERERRGEQEND